MRRVFSITKRRHAGTALDGEGARLAGGRWNRPGLPAVYCSESRALAALETFVHISQEAAEIDFVVVEIQIPDAVLVETWRPASNSAAAVPSHHESQTGGSAWLEHRAAAILEVPSVLIPEERNFVLNPLHRDFAKLKAQPPSPFRFDLRLWK